jgi:integrase
MNDSGLRQPFKTQLKKAGLPSTLRVYDLRHGCATMLFQAGEHPKVVSERLGHASIKITLDTYTHAIPNMQEAASERLESAICQRPVNRPGKGVF